MASKKFKWTNTMTIGAAATAAATIGVGVYLHQRKPAAGSPAALQALSADLSEIRDPAQRAVVQATLVNASPHNPATIPALTQLASSLGQGGYPDSLTLLGRGVAPPYPKAAARVRTRIGELSAFALANPNPLSPLFV